MFLQRIQIPCIEVDAHNIVPCWLASPKQEFGAYTLRPKIHRLLPDFLTDLPALQAPPVLLDRACPRHRLGPGPGLGGGRSTRPGRLLVPAG